MIITASSMGVAKSVIVTNKYERGNIIQEPQIMNSSVARFSQFLVLSVVKGKT